MLFISEALANSAPQAVQQPSPVAGFIPIIIIFIIFYFLLIRPQQKKIKIHNEMINAVKKGDVVVTSGGTIGKVEKITEDDILHIKIADNVVIQVIKSTLTNVLDKKFTPVKPTEAKVKSTKKVKK